MDQYHVLPRVRDVETMNMIFKETVFLWKCVVALEICKIILDIFVVIFKIIFRCNGSSALKTSIILLGSMFLYYLIL